MKEIEDINRKLLQTQRLEKMILSKMLVLLKADYSFSVIPSKISVRFYKT